LRREHLEHIIRAAADVAEDDEIVVVGSQAILASFPDAPPALLASQEADVYPRNRPERAAAIDGNLGDGSAFHEAFGYYAHGVGPETAKAPEGWEDRLVAVRVEVERGRVVTGWCMEAHDLVLAKCAARRDRDWRYAEDAIRAGLVDPAELLRRAPGLPLAAADLNYVLEMLGALVERMASDS
jgi:hypothetical protein